MRAFRTNGESRLVGISGTFGSGKDTAANHLAKNWGFMHVSTGDVCRAEATRLGLDHERPTLVEIAIDLRRQYGGNIGALVFKGIEQWQERRVEFTSGLVMSGLRIVGEVEVLQGQRGKSLFVDAPPATRYEWVLQRAKAEGRTIELQDVHCLADFEESERAELEGLGGPERPNIRGIEAIADEVIQNTGTRADFLRRVEGVLGLAC